jgi:hypothetical protein
LGRQRAVSLEDWCAFLGEQVGRTAKFAVMPFAIPSACIDPARMHEIAGPTKVGWRDGFARMVAARQT